MDHCRVNASRYGRDQLMSKAVAISRAIPMEMKFYIMTFTIFAILGYYLFLGGYHG
jgi:hypothetical protein